VGRGACRCGCRVRRWRLGGGVGRRRGGGCWCLAQRRRSHLRNKGNGGARPSRVLFGQRRQQLCSRHRRGRAAARTHRWRGSAWQRRGSRLQQGRDSGGRGRGWRQQWRGGGERDGGGGGCGRSRRGRSRKWRKLLRPFGLFTACLAACLAAWLGLIAGLPGKGRRGSRGCRAPGRASGPGRGSPLSRRLGRWSAVGSCDRGPRRRAWRFRAKLLLLGRLRRSGARVR
jgi:hypothetical protein